MDSETPSARELSRHLIAGEVSVTDGPASTAAAAHLACDRVYAELARWVGVNGAAALFTRSLAHVRTEHPLLAGVRTRTLPDTGLEGVTEAAQSHGPKAVAAALEALLVTVLELLGRLIGDDMSARLVKGATSDRARETHESEKDETTQRRSATP